MGVLQSLIKANPRIGRQSFTISWPKALNYLVRPGELSAEEAVDLVDFLSTEDGLVVRDGYTQLGSAALDNIPLRMAPYEQEDLDRFTMAHTKTKLYYLNAGVWTDISRAGGYTGSDDQPYDSCVCLNDYVFTNYTDKIQLWDGVAGTAIDIPASAAAGALEFTRAKYCTYFAGRLFIANLKEESPTKIRALRVRWSAELVYKTSADWTSLGSGFNDLAETPDEITGLMKLASFLVAYKKRSIVHIIESGDINRPFFVDWRLTADLDKGVGLVSHQTLANMQGFHLGLFNDNVYRYDGSRPIPVGDAVIRDVVRLANISALQKAFSVYDPIRAWYMLFVPLAGQAWPGQAYVYDARRDLWIGKVKKSVSAATMVIPSVSTTWASTDPQTWEDVDASWGSFGQDTALPILTIGSPDDKKIRQIDSGADYDGSPAEWTTPDLDCGFPEHEKTILRVRLRCDTGGVAQQVTAAVSLDSGKNFSAVANAVTNVIQGEQDIFFDFRKTATRFTIKFTSPDKIRLVEWGVAFQVRGRSQ